LRDSRPEEDEAVTGLPWIRALFRLTPPLHALIHGFKYRHQPRHIGFLCAWLRWRRAWIADLAATYDALVPVPLHASRARERGFNQAERLARRVRALGGLPVLAVALRRTRPTGTQTRLRRDARAENLDGVFRADPARVAGKRLLLVDDVCTTGSTLRHCREALLAAGAARVDALVLAEVEKKMEKGPPDLEIAAGFFG
jgi:ComF family protein